jgi:hypothetical protein
VGVLDILAGVFKPIVDIVDHLTVSGDEKAKLQSAVIQAQFTAQMQSIEYEKQLLDARSNIVLAEAKSDSWLTKSWRPITALTLVALVVARFLGYTAPGVSPAEYIELWSLVKLCLGGYIGSRGVEKIAPAVGNIMKTMRTSNG